MEGVLGMLLGRLSQSIIVSNHAVLCPDVLCYIILFHALMCCVMTWYNITYYDVLSEDIT